MKRELIPYNVMRHADWDRSPKMPQSLAIALAPSLFTAAGASIGLGGLLLTGAIGVGLSAVTSWAMQALAPKPDLGRFGNASAGLLVNDKNNIAPQDFIYGEVRKGGTVVYDETTGAENKFLHRVIALAGHEVEEIGDIYVNDEVVAFDSLFDYEVTLNYITYVGEAGTPTNKTKVVKFGGAKAPDAVYDSGESLTLNDLLDLDANSTQSDLGVGVSTFFNTLLRDFDSATVDSKTTSGDGFVVEGPYAGKIRVSKHLGDQTAPDPDLVSESELEDEAGNKIINENFVGNGIAYLYVRLEYDREVFANGLPLITAKIKGKKVYDPRTGSTTYSNNAALCLRDYLTANYGLSDTDIDEDAFEIAANECDEAVALAEGGSEARYTMNGVVRADQKFGEVLQQMTTCSAGTLFCGMGAWDLVAGAYSAPVENFTLGDLRGPISVDPLTNLRDAFNAVSGTFSDAEQDYITVDYPAITSSVFEAEDGGERLPLDLELPFTTSSASAQRLAKLTLLRSREQIGITADFSLKAFNVEVGDIITFTNERYGWDQKQFEVVGWNLNIGEEGGLSVRLTLQETSAAAFDWDAEETQITANNTNLPNIFDGLEVTGLSASNGGRIQTDGTFINTTVLSWTEASSSFVNEYEVRWQPTLDEAYSSTTTSNNSVELSPVVDGVEYFISVRAITDAGNRGPFASIHFTPGQDTTAPGVPTNLSTSGGYNQISIKWTNPTDADLKEVEVYGNSSDTTSGAMLIGKISGSEFIETGLASDATRYYFLKSVDFTGNKSAFTSSVSGTTLAELTDGSSFNFITAFIRSASTPATPTGGSYDFGTKTLTPPSGWSATVPSGSDPLYVSNTTAETEGSTGVDDTLTWTAPVLFAQNGDQGVRGPGRWYIPISSTSYSSLPITEAQADDAWNDVKGTGDIPLQAVVYDQVIYYEGSEANPTKQQAFIASSVTSETVHTWNEQEELIDGDLLVTGTVTADRLSIGDSSLSADENGDLVVQGGNITVLEDNFYTPSFPIDGDDTLNLVGGATPLVPPGFTAQIQVVASFGHGYSNIGGGADQWGYNIYALMGASLTAVNADELVPGARAQIVTLGDTSWNDVAGTTGVTYAAGDYLDIVQAGTGTGTAYQTHDLDIMKLRPVDEVQAGDIVIIDALGTTDWNALAGTTGVTYQEGDFFETVTAGSGTGIVYADTPYILDSRYNVLMSLQDDQPTVACVMRDVKNFNLTSSSQISIFIEWIGKSADIKINKCLVSVFMRFK